MNYQQAIADAIRQIIFQNVDAATTAAAVGFGSLSCFHAAVVTETVWAFSTTAADADAITTMAAAAGSGFSFCSSAVADAAAIMAADAYANRNFPVSIYEGSCNTNPLKL